MRCAECQRSFHPLRADAVTCSTRCRVARYRRLKATTPPWPAGTYDLVMVDLPLRWVGYSTKGEGRSPQRHYDTMDVPGLIAWRPMVEAFTAKNSAFAFWVYGPRLPDTLRVIEGWGLTYKSELLIWRKTGWRRFGGGKTTRKSVENVWLATRGKGLPIRDHGVDQFFETPRGEHSEKPEEAYRRLERLYGNVRRLDLFARLVRRGWTAWGNQVEIDLLSAL